jgi:hypothetical protein
MLITNEIDMNSYEHIDNLVYWEKDRFFDQEQYTEYKDIIFDQLVDFNNLGQDMFKVLNMDDYIKHKILQDLIDYCRDNYLNLIDVDFIQNSTQLEKIGLGVYSFLCVDCFNMILPNLIDQLRIQNVAQFDRVIIKKADNINYIKTQLLTNISDVVNNLLKLQKIDHTISTDGSYKLLINRFGYYLELIDFSDSYKFVENYIRPVLNKYFDQLMWRTL